MRTILPAFLLLALLVSPVLSPAQAPRLDSVSPQDVLPDESRRVILHGEFHADTVAWVDEVGELQGLFQDPEWGGELMVGYTLPLPVGVSPGFKAITVSDSKGSHRLENAILFVEFGQTYLIGCFPWEIPPEGGTIVQIEGRNFHDGHVPAFHPSGNEVDLHPCTDILELAPDHITVRMPALPSRLPGDFYDCAILDGPFGDIQARRGEVLAVYEGTVVHTLTSVAPGEIDARGGTPVEIHGENLRSSSSYYVGIRLIQITEAPSEEIIRGIVPYIDPNPPGGAYDLVVTDGRGEVRLPSAVRAVDKIRSVTPSTVELGSSVLLTFDGFGFEEAYGLQIGGKLLDSPVFLNSERMQGTLQVDPAIFSPGSHAAYLVDVAGEIAGYLPDAVTVQDSGTLHPRIVSVSPGQVSTRGGELMTVTLDSPAGTASVLVGDVTLVNLDSSNPLSLVGEVPPLAAGIHAVELVATNGQVLDSLPDAVEAVDPLGITITTVTPYEVATTGGTEVTFTGTGFELAMTPRLGGFELTSVEVIDGQHLRGVSPALSEGPHSATLHEGTTPLARLDNAVAALPIESSASLTTSRPWSSRFIGGVDNLSLSVQGLAAGAVLRVGGVEVIPTPPTTACTIGAGGGGGGAGAETLQGTFEGIVPELPPGIYAVDIYLPGKGILKVLDDAVEVASNDSPPVLSHVVSTEVARDGSTRLYIFGSGFGAQTEFLVGGKPLMSPTLVSNKLVIGFAPPLEEGDEGGIKGLSLVDPRGDSSTPAALSYTKSSADGPLFIRGDSNQSGRVDISDAVTTLGYLFLGNPQSLACTASADIDANAKVDISDPIQLLQHLFLGGPEPVAPYPTCGLANEPSPLGCGAFSPCGSGGGGALATGSLQANVFVLGESRSAPGDPIVRDLNPVTGQVVLDDPPGGLDLKSGDIIAGYVPPTSPAIYEGVTYLLKLQDSVASSCLATSPTDNVFTARSASLSEVFESAAIQTTLPGIKGNVRLPPGSATVSGRTNCEFDQGAGGGEPLAGGAETDGGGAVIDPLIDVNFTGLSFFHWQDGPNFVDAGFNRLRLKYAASEASLGLSITDGGLDGLTFFSGILLDSEIELYLSSHFEKHIQEEKKLLTLRKDYLVLVVGIPIHFAATGDLYAGIDMNAQVNLYIDAGAKASFKAGLGFQFDGSDFKNVSGLEPPSFAPLPGTPDIDLNGSVVAKAYLKPEVHLFAGILFRGLTADLGIRCEAFTRFHATGSTKPLPCFNWGIDAGISTTLNPEIQLFGYDLFDETTEILHEEELNILGGEYGCHYPPVARVSYFTVPLPGDKFEVHLDASASYDPDGGPLRYRWDFDDDGKCDIESGGPQTIYHSDRACPFYDQVELFSVCGRGRLMRLQVTDDEGVSTNKVFKIILQ